MLVYAPVSLESLSEAETRSLAANEAWVSRRPSGEHPHHQRKGSYGRIHAHAHGHGRRNSRGMRTELPVLEESEEVLPMYSDEPEREGERGLKA